MLLLSAPLLWHLFAPESENVENRTLATMPHWPENWNDVEISKSELEAYFEDHFGLRATLIKWANQLNYHVFGEVTSPQVTMGKAGYIYFNSHNKVAPNALTKEVCGRINPSDVNKTRSKKGIESFLELYQQKGIKASVVVIPTKARIYPEYLPTQHKHWCSQNNTSWVDELIDLINNQNVIYPLQEFRDWKDSFQVYLPKYFHWNGDLPERTAAMIMQQWGIDVKHKVTLKDHRVKSDLSNHLPGLSLTDMSTKFSYENLKFCDDKNCIKNFTDKYQNGSVVLSETNTDTGRNLLILGDSFTPQITPHFSPGFDNTYSINLNHLKKAEEQEFFKWITSYTQPTHIIYLVHDGGLLWQALRLERIMNALK